MNWLYLAAGVLLLFFGRKAMWLFVALVGFLLAARFVPEMLPGQSQSVILTLSLIAGLLGALLAVLLQKLAVGLAGLAAGAFITHTILGMTLITAGQNQWLLIVAGALIGAVLAGSLFDWAMILVTSATGAVLIYQGLNLQLSFYYIILAGVMLLGIIVQGNIKSKG